MDYQFTNDWFASHAGVWAEVFSWIKPRSALEIGSYEGRSTCYMIEQIGRVRSGEIHCIDTWEGGVEHARENMGAVEKRFDANVSIALEQSRYPIEFHKHKGKSQRVLPIMLSDRKEGYFDLIYVDGSHQAPDVIFDAVVGFLLLKKGGVIIFDDYIWQMEDLGSQDHYNMPKPAIDAFFNIYRQKLKPFIAPLSQVYLQKIAE